MSSRLAFQTQLASIMEVLANAAVAEICKLVDDDYAVVSVQMSQCQRENKVLKRKLHLLELKMARGNAERRLGGIGRSRVHFSGADRFRETAAASGGAFDQQVDVGPWSGKAASTGCADNQPVHSDVMLPKSPDVELVERKDLLVKEENIEANKVEEQEEDVPLIGDDGVLEIVHRGASGQSARPGQPDNQSQSSRARPPSGSSRGVEMGVGPKVVPVKLEDMETRSAAHNQSALSIQEGLVESSTDDYRGGLLIDDSSQAALSDLQEPGGGFTESAPSISRDAIRITAVRHGSAEENTPTKSNTHAPLKISNSSSSTLSSDYSLFELETFFTRWAPDPDPDLDTGPASGGPSCTDDSTESDPDGVTIIESEPPTTRMGLSSASLAQAGASVSATLSMQVPSSQHSWNKMRRMQELQELQQTPKGHTAAKSTLSFSRVSPESGSRNRDASNMLGLSSTSRTMSSTTAPQPSSSARVPAGLAGVEATVAAQQRAHFLVQKSREAGVMYAEGRRKSFVCRICGKAFTGQSNLEAHERVHTGEKPYRCDTCGKHFSEAGNLKKHQRVHTGEKPFRCNQCGKTFAWICNLRTHQQSATGCNPRIGGGGGMG